MEVKKFECPCCNAELIWSAEKGQMICEYCGTEIPADAMDVLSDPIDSNDRIDWRTYDANQMDNSGMRSYSCKSCGAEITGDSTVAASECPYCGNSVVMNDQVQGGLKPDYIIPFKITKEKAIEQFKSFCHGKPLLPSDFINDHRIEKVEGLYVPYWLFDCKADGNLRFRGEQVSSHREGNYEVTTTRHFLLVREGSMEFEHVPVDAIKKLDNTVSEAVEPYDTHAAQAFNPAYLSGFLADRFDVSAEECKPRINERIKSSLMRSMENTASAYTSVRYESGNVSVNNGKVNYALLPMWLMSAVYQGKTYNFAINGQTGRFVGELPVSSAKVMKFILGITAGVAAVVGGIMYMMLK